MNLGMVHESTFFSVQDTYCLDPIETFWEKCRNEIVTRLRQKDQVVILGKECFSSNSITHLFIVKCVCDQV